MAYGRGIVSSRAAYSSVHSNASRPSRRKTRVSTRKHRMKRPVSTAMAQFGVTNTSLDVTDAAAPRKQLTDWETHQLVQFEKIVRFRDAVLSGSHPTIKVPLPDAFEKFSSPDVVKYASQSLRATDGPSKDAISSSTANAVDREPEALDDPGSSGATESTAPKATPNQTGRPRFNLVLLEKSIELVKAEVAIQRQRLERALHESSEQQRHAKTPQDEPFTSLDVSEVLKKAQVLVPAVTVTSPADKDLNANHSIASDSFDDNTFYSSQHDTSQSHMTSRIRHESDENDTSGCAHRQSRLASPQAGTVCEQSTQDTAMAQADQTRPRVDDHELLVNAVSNVRYTCVPGLNYATAGNTPRKAGQDTACGEQRQAKDVPMVDSGPAAVSAVKDNVQQLDDSYVEMHPPSPLIRGHALQPVAPPPAQIRPLAVSGRRQPPANPIVQRARDSSVKVAAPGLGSSVATSPESSSNGTRLTDRQRNKKRWKLDRPVPAVEANSLIKVEPQSLSPVNAPWYGRANKRQRLSQRQVMQVECGPPVGRSPAQGPIGQYLPHPYGNDATPLSYDEGLRYPPQRAMSVAVVAGRSYGQDYMENRRQPGDGSHFLGYQYSGAATPLAYSPPTMAYQPRPMSRGFAADAYHDPPRPYHDYLKGARLSVRSEADPYTGHTGSMPPRVMVDAHGREHLDAPHAVAQHPSAPSARPGEPGFGYVRPPPRTVSRPTGHESYQEEGAVYGGRSTGYAMRGRILSQPTEYQRAPYEYPDGPQREYPPLSMAAPPPKDFVDMGASAHEASRGGYAARATSMMPMESVQYEVPQAYGRMQSARPDMGRREYVPGTHAEGQREVMQPYLQEYATQPTKPF